MAWRSWRVPRLEPLPAPPAGAIRAAAPCDDDRGLESTIHYRFARAPFMTVVDIAEGRVLGVRSVRNPAVEALRGAGMMVAQWLIASGVRVVLAPMIGPNASMVLQQAGISIYRVSPGTRLSDALIAVGLLRG